MHQIKYRPALPAEPALKIIRPCDVKNLALPPSVNVCGKRRATGEIYHYVIAHRVASTRWPRPGQYLDTEKCLEILNNLSASEAQQCLMILSIVATLIQVIAEAFGTQLRRDY
ncbi:hypothetical protein EVAR_63627_1 [Eumeta japonica]|uniref:Uncharacterized protein n=1 Tax=Eumeta variegata TaxID=151549 RepID=A0A4C1ZV15_EUMVA|nr:hypothetical protein EVAR_63627_1 [Eumeta japonica]